MGLERMATWSSNDKSVQLTIGKPRVGRGIDVLTRINTDIIVNDLVGSVSWEINDKICLKVNRKKYFWQIQEDMSWKQVEE